MKNTQFPTSNRVVQLDNLKLKSSEKLKISTVLKKSLRFFTKIAIRFTVATCIIILLTYFGIFNLLNEFLTNYFTFLNDKELTILSSALFNYLLAMYITGMYLSNNVLTIKEELTTLFIAQIISTPLVHVRLYIPNRLAFFSANIVIKWSFFDIFTSILTSLLCLTLVLYCI